VGRGARPARYVARLEAEREGLEIFGAPNLGENPRGDVEGQRDWWAA
jgi:hypothetical protein